MSRLKYPIYIISKGRWENPLTAKFLLSAGIPFTIAVEPQEYEDYISTIPERFVAKLPFSNLGVGSYPARNWCWEDSIQRGFECHFLFDDNIYGFIRLNNGQRKKHEPLEPLILAERIMDMYDKMAIVGYNYSGFAGRWIKKPFVANTHVYSGMLINNEIPYRWRMKYNEDVDLCLQALHNKWNTILLNVFLIHKVSTTSKMKGGNQTELYQGNNDFKKALKTRSLELVWPQYVKTSWRFGRPHHIVSWRKHFPHPLKRIE